MRRTLFPCPSCSGYTRVLSTNMALRGEHMTRQRVCEDCGGRFQTREMVHEPIDTK
jgi:transcriptional regulator NrdR family protein